VGLIARTVGALADTAFNPMESNADRTCYAGPIKQSGKTLIPDRDVQKISTFYLFATILTGWEIQVFQHNLW
jgi:hypothetical protein